MRGDSSYREMKFIFDSEGRVAVRTLYNRKGIPHSVYNFDRNIDGFIIKQTFNYIDSLEQPFENSSPEVIDFSYDTKERISKKKERDFYGKIRDDSESTYTTYQYDDKGRIIEEYRQYYYEGKTDNEVSKYFTDWMFDDSKSTSISETWLNNNLFLSTKTTYNSKGKPLSEIQFNNLRKKHAGQTKYKYNENNQLIWFSIRSGEGSISECPDGGTYTESYSYGNDDLIKSIEHSYGLTTCKMVFNYE